MQPIADSVALVRPGTAASHPAPTPPTLRARLLATLAVFTTAALLCLAALLNGQPLLYPDSPVYVRRGEVAAGKLLGADRIKPWLGEHGAPGAPGQAPAGTPADDGGSVSLAGRSVYYGAFLYAAHAAGSLWLAVVAQALCVAGMLYLVIVRLWGFGVRHLVAVGAGLAVLTPLAAFAGLLMPDVFAGLTVLCSGVLAAYWQRLRRPERIAVAALLLFAIAAHPSHLALAAVMLVFVLGCKLLRRGPQTQWPALAVLVACVLGGVAAEWVFNKAMAAATGSPPVRLPHSTGHLIMMGPGTEFLRQNCPEAGYEVCRYVANFPTHWDDFLFSEDPAKGAFWLADAPGKRRMAAQQTAFVLDVLRFDPVGVARGLGADVLEQLASFRVDVGHQPPHAPERYYVDRVPDDVLADFRDSRGMRGGDIDGWLSGATYATVAGSLLLLGWRRRSSLLPRPTGFNGLALVIGAGVLANAVICAVFAAPLDRFQSRVMWLVPLLAAAVLMQLRIAGRPVFDSPSMTGTPVENRP